MDNLRKLDVVFCESTPIYEAVRREGIRVIKAFGTDTDFFCPGEGGVQDIEYFYPATFSPWKRQQDIAHLGEKLLCVGTIQPDGQRIYEHCLNYGVQVEVGYFPVETIRDYYRRTRKMIIPAVHGSERTVLEAMSCGIVPEVTSPENARAQSYIKELEASGLSPREFVVKNYSHVKYAEDLLRGMG
jgi:glycosyltransferase involved in cell wall biosynthesis